MEVSHLGPFHRIFSEEQILKICNKFVAFTVFFKKPLKGLVCFSLEKMRSEKPVSPALKEGTVQHWQPLLLCLSSRFCKRPESVVT
jgi:hypothetical protein